MVRNIIVSVYIAVWGIATIVILIKKGEIPAEYWTLPAVGLGGLLAALSSLEKKSDKKKEKEPPPEPEDPTVKEEV